jgi:hypothetical protein
MISKHPTHTPRNSAKWRVAGLHASAEQFRHNELLWLTLSPAEQDKINRAVDLLNSILYCWSD